MALRSHPRQRGWRPGAERDPSQDPAPERGTARRIGLLGGSFNPAHEGHLHISVLALERLDLDELWWLVSPQNPLKPSAGMAPLGQRLEAARAIARDPRIRVTDIERALGTRYTIDTLRALKTRHPGVRFVWVMGADNLIEIRRWKEWRSIFRMLPIAVFARPSYVLRALRSGAARRFASARKGRLRAADLAGLDPPAWVLLQTPRHAASATRIRARRGAAGLPAANVRGSRAND